MNNCGRIDLRIRILFLSALVFSVFLSGSSQPVWTIQYGITAEENLKAIANLTPNSVGGLGFDTRYEGIRGSPRLFDTLINSYLKVKGQDFYIKLNTNIDLVNNTLLFMHPTSGNLLQIPSDIVVEVVFDKGEEQFIYRTIEGRSLDRDLNNKRFCQLLTDKPVMFLKLPLKKMVEADFKGAYSPDRRYDEFVSYYRYYIMGSDSTFHQIQLSKKSLQKTFPEKKSLIEEGFGKANKVNDEGTVISILQKF